MNTEESSLKNSHQEGVVGFESPDLIEQKGGMSLRTNTDPSSKKFNSIFIVLLIFVMLCAISIWYLWVKEKKEVGIYDERVESDSMLQVEEEMAHKDSGSTIVKHDINTWVLYKNDEFGIEFKYPSDWIPIKMEKQLTSDLFLFDSDNPSIEKIYYYKPDQILALVGLGEEYSYKVGAMEEVDYYHEMRLTYFLQNGTEDIIYNTNSGDCMGGSIGIEDLNFAPCGRYINFFDCCFTSRKPTIFDAAEKRREILVSGFRDGVYWHDSYKHVVWTPDCEKFFIRSYIHLVDLDAKPDSIWEGSFGSYEHFRGLKPMFLVSQIQGHEEEELEIGEMSLVNDNILYFNIRQSRHYDGEGEYISGPIIMEYEYNIESREIKRIK